MASIMPFSRSQDSLYASQRCTGSSRCFRRNRERVVGAGRMNYVDSIATEKFIGICVLEGDFLS